MEGLAFILTPGVRGTSSSLDTSIVALVCPTRETVLQNTPIVSFSAHIGHSHRVAHHLERGLHGRRQLAELLSNADLAILNALKAELQKREEDKCKLRHKHKFGALLCGVQH